MLIVVIGQGSGVSCRAVPSLDLVIPPRACREPQRTTDHGLMGKSPDPGDFHRGRALDLQVDHHAQLGPRRLPQEALDLPDVVDLPELPDLLLEGLDLVLIPLGLLAELPEFAPAVVDRVELPTFSVAWRRVLEPLRPRGPVRAPLDHPGAVRLDPDGDRAGVRRVDRELERHFAGDDIPLELDVMALVLLSYDGRRRFDHSPHGPGGITI